MIIKEVINIKALKYFANIALGTYFSFCFLELKFFYIPQKILGSSVLMGF